MPYNVAGRHCVTFVQGALRTAGIDPYGDVLTRFPVSFYDALKALRDAGADSTKG